MKVLHVNEHLALKGGVETYLFSLIPLLRARGVESEVAYGEGDPDFYHGAHHVPEIGMAGFGSRSAGRRQLEEVLECVGPDLVHIHNVQNVGVLRVCLDRYPTVMTTHDYRWVCPANTFFYKRTQDICGRGCGPRCFTTTLTKHCLTPRPQYASYFYYRSRWAVRHAQAFSHVIAPSWGAKDRYVQGGFHPDQISVLPYFCSLEPSAAPRPVPHQHTITFLGRISPNKGHEFFVEALGRLPDSVRGVMVGGLSEAGRAGLMRQAEEEGCADRLELRGWASRDEVLDLFDQTSVFVFPSLWPETLGIVGLEAFSRGVPVVASDVGGVRQWLEDGVNGYVVPPKDAGAIAASVLRLVEDEGRLLRFGQSAIQTIRERFLPRTHVDGLVDIYDRILVAEPNYARPTYHQ